MLLIGALLAAACVGAEIAYRRRLGESYLIEVNDINERRRAEERSRQLRRVHARLSNVNQLMVRIRDPLALSREACRIAVVDSGSSQILLHDALEALQKEIRTCGATFLVELPLRAGVERSRRRSTGFP